MLSFVHGRVRIALLLLLVQFGMGGCSGGLLLNAGAKRLATMKLDRGRPGDSPVQVSPDYHPPPGPPVLVALATDSQSIEWRLNLADAIEFLGPLEPTYGELLAHESVKIRHMERRSTEVIKVPGAEGGTVWSSSWNCPPTATDSKGNRKSNCVDPSPEDNAENPDDDSYLALAEYRSTDADRQTASLGESGVSVHVYYEFCAEHLSESVHPIGRTFSPDDLFLCGERLSFVATEPPDAQERVLAWLVKHYTMTPELQRIALPHDSSTANTGSSAHAAVLAMPSSRSVSERYRWCGPSPGSEMYTPCPATVTYAFDRTTRCGAILVMTPPVYQYLWARQHFTDNSLTARKLAGPNRYLALLFADPQRFASGSAAFLCRDCGPENFPLTPALRAQFMPDNDLP